MKDEPYPSDPGSQNENTLLRYITKFAEDYGLQNVESDRSEEKLRKERAEADKEAELAKKEKQKNTYRIPYLLFSGGVALIWLLFTAFLIYQSGLDNSSVNVDDRVLIAMLGTAFVSLYAPLHVIAKYLFNGQK